MTCFDESGSTSPPQRASADESLARNDTPVATLKSIGAVQQRNGACHDVARLHRGSGAGGPAIRGTEFERPSVGLGGRGG